MKSEYLNLSIEQEFTIHRFERASHDLPSAELRKLFIEATRQLLIKDNVICHLLKNVPIQ